MLGRAYGVWREHREAGLRGELEKVWGGRRLRRGFDTWWQGVLVGRLGFTVFRKPGIGATGDWIVGALKKGWEKLQASRGFGVWKGLMMEGRKLRESELFEKMVQRVMAGVMAEERTGRTVDERSLYD